MLEYININAKRAIKKLESKRERRQLLIYTLIFSIILVLTIITFLAPNSKNTFPDYFADCKSYQELPLLFNKSYDKILNENDYKLKIVDKLTNAIKIPTVVYDSFGQPDLNCSLSDDPEYSEFQKFHDYLEKAFPLVHKNLKKEIVNKVGLVYTWTPKIETDAKPLLLMAHQDVVPVEPSTIDKWTHPPFEGHYDELTGKIYGRGAQDTKLFLIAQFATVELLLTEKYSLKKPLILAYGFDEEKGGDFGAQFIAQFLFERYGEDGIDALFDEGPGIAQLDENTFIAAPGVAEMGYCDVYIELETLGGHSSAPNHWEQETTGIGIMSEINYLLTQEQFKITVSKDNPVLNFLQCNAKYNPDSLDPHILKAVKSNSLIQFKNAIQTTDDRFTFKTTQSMDVIKGGIKANAMPESIVNVINHRIDIQSSISETVNHDLKHILNVAAKYNLGVSVDWLNNGELEIIKNETSLGNFNIRVVGGLEPVGRIPYDSFYDMVASTCVTVYSDPIFRNSETKVDFLFEGTMTPGNTDSVYYAMKNLVNGRVYRFSGALMEWDNEHTVDEWSSDKALMTSHAFVYSLIVNFNEYY
ncbi:carboxypeptidase S [Hanseniaspora valbyensis NRRL Y-1626]|uniref:Carboxypeptidase S n=1 Tax=Hanseniaspora valbyensis NRRL Y-1626 TaxID=766949 RepID=A0A1B7TJC6_9ASCO|nr:carboxypeptidase S [Hanseniaspora valbyensis NRRL Y-1626]